MFLFAFALLWSWISTFLLQKPSNKCAKHSQKAEYILIGGRAQGTTYQITYGAADTVLSATEVDSIFRVIDHSLSLYEPASLINQFNSSSSGIYADSHLLRVVQKAIEVYEQTGGAFDITVKPLVDLWGFGVLGRGSVPDSTQIKQAMASVGTRHLWIRDGFLGKKLATVQIDCNGIAQGYTVDLFADWLSKRGVTDYLVEIGGEIRCSGKNSFGRPWRIGVASAADQPAALGRSWVISPGAAGISTAGTYGRNYTHQGKELHHIIDPHTGYPTRNGVIAVTIVAPDAMTADAWDNASFVLGPVATFHLIRGFPGIEARICYRNLENQILDTLSFGMRSWLTEALNSGN